MRALVTGINGFAGRHLRLELEKRGHEVWGIDTYEAGTGITAADILDAGKIKNIIKELSPEVVIHLAAISSVDHKDPSAVYNVNFNGTLNLLSACVGARVLSKFLFVSSSQAYGNVDADKLPIDESFPLDPVNHYGAGKAAAEMAVRAFSAEYGLPFVIARPFNHTGPGQTDRFVVPKIVSAFRRRDESIELGNTDTVRDYTDVRDVVKAYAGLMENFQSGEVYNISGGRGLTVAEIFKKVTQITGHNMKIIRHDSLVRGNEIRNVIGCYDKLKISTGWQPELPLETTLRDMLGL